MFSVSKIANGFIIHNNDSETFCKNEKALVTGIRNVLGMKKVGRPPKVNKVAEKVYNGLDSDPF
jgi:hypothetical protein